MNAYETAVRADRYLICGGSLTDGQQSRTAEILLAARSSPAEAARFRAAVRAPGDIMYPEFFIPPYNGGKKHKTLLNQTPKTHILSANSYELEILRLLNLLAPNSPDVREMTSATLERLRASCFGGQGCAVGECYDTSLVALRFVAGTAPGEIEWMGEITRAFRRHYSDKKRPWYNIWYFRLCLSEMPFFAALPEIEREKPDMLNWLKNKSCVMKSEHDRAVHPVLFCVLRNILAKYPEYAHIKDRAPYVSGRDGRLHFDMSESGDAEVAEEGGL